jgi:MSHA pilin protein MshA
MEYQMNQRGFTLIEILMVIMLVAILAAVAIPQFIDFRGDAKNAALQSSVGAMRTAIMTQYSNSILKCNAKSGQYPTAAQIAANDITTGDDPCTAAMITNAGERQFVAGTIPDNPWSGSAAASKNSVTACSGATTGCSQTDATNCAGAAYTTADGGWCYDKDTGKIWANSNNNATTNEYTF